MDHRTTLFLIAAVLAAPAPAFSQAWPASVVASGPHLLPSTAAARSFVVVRPEETAVRRRPNLPPTDPRTPNLKLAADRDEIPQVDLRPKAEWSDDQGLRVGPTKVAFKRRF